MARPPRPSSRPSTGSCAGSPAASSPALGVTSLLHEAYVDIAQREGVAWNPILVIPVLEGVALAPGAWVIPYFDFAASSAPDRPLLRLLQPLSTEEVETLGLEISADSRTKTFDELIQKLTIIQYHFKHLGVLRV